MAPKVRTTLSRKQVRFEQQMLFNVLTETPESWAHDHWFVWGPEFMAERYGVKDEDVMDRYEAPAPGTPRYIEFRAWADEQDIMYRWYHEREADELPPYLVFSSPTAVTDGTWLIHFSHDPFTSFDLGADIRSLAYTGRPGTKAPVADCAKIVAGSDMPLYGFAYEADDRVYRYGHKYGRSSVLFRAEGAVRAYHSGDVEWQVIFPLCTKSVSTVYPLHLDEGGGVSIEDASYHEHYFDSLSELMAVLDTKRQLRQPEYRALAGLRR